MKISTIIPVFKCSDCLNELIERLINILSSITDDFDIILVNDSSPDNSWEVIKKMALKDVRVKVLIFLEILASIMPSQQD